MNMIYVSGTIRRGKREFRYGQKTHRYGCGRSVQSALQDAEQRGQIPIPFSIKRKNYLSNLKAVTEDPFSDEDMKLISGIDRDCRLIKGRVFLWPGAKDWEDLWDIEGGQGQ